MSYTMQGKLCTLHEESLCERSTTNQPPVHSSRVITSLLLESRAAEVAVPSVAGTWLTATNKADTPTQRSYRGPNWVSVYKDKFKAMAVSVATSSYR